MGEHVPPPPPDRDDARMWVRLDGQEGDEFVGRLLSAPHQLTRVQEGSRLRVHHAGRGRLVALGEVEAANRAEFDIRCDPCGFDVLPVPFADLAARQFPGVEGELVALTTRCPACGGGMLIKRRGNEST